MNTFSCQKHLLVSLTCWPGQSASEWPFDHRSDTLWFTFPQPSASLENISLCPFPPATFVRRNRTWSWTCRTWLLLTLQLGSYSFICFAVTLLHPLHDLKNQRECLKAENFYLACPTGYLRLRFYSWESWAVFCSYKNIYFITFLFLPHLYIYYMVSNKL